MRKVMWGAASGLVLAASATIVTASVPDANGTISACVNDRTGVVRIIDSAKPGLLGRCISSGLLVETGVVWNASGAPGPAGPVGLQGPAGPAGPPGPTSLLSLCAGTLTVVEVPPSQNAQVVSRCPEG